MAEPPIQTTGRSRERLLLPEWIAALKAKGEKPIPPGHPIIDYAERIGITEEMLVVHWRVFKARHMDGDRRQADWRRKLLISIQGNWYKLWFVDAQGRMCWTTPGIQAQREWGDA